MQTELQEQHRWLQRFVGEWTYRTQVVSEGKAQTFDGRATVRALGDFWILCEEEGEMPGMGVVKTIVTLGYDPDKKGFVGTWIGSFSSMLMVYEGQRDGQVLTLSTMGPSMEGGDALVPYHDVHELTGEGQRRFWSQVQKPDGSWETFMTFDYRRAGA